MIVFSTVGVVGSKNNGFPTRFPEDDLKFLNQLGEHNSIYVSKKFNTLKSADWEPNKKKIFVVGDSYAMDLTNAVFESDLQKTISLSTWLISNLCGNLFIPFEEKQEFILKKDRPQCHKTNVFKNEEFIHRLQNADEIWLASLWEPWQIELLEKSIQNIQLTTTGVVNIFGTKLNINFEPRRYLGLSSEKRKMLVEPIDAGIISINDQFSELAKKYNFIDVQALICGGDVKECKVFDPSGYIKTFDGGHLTASGARFLGNSLIKSTFIP